MSNDYTDRVTDPTTKDLPIVIDAVRKGLERNRLQLLEWIDEQHNSEQLMQQLVDECADEFNSERAEEEYGGDDQTKETVEARFDFALGHAVVTVELAWGMPPPEALRKVGVH